MNDDQAINLLREWMNCYYSKMVDEDLLKRTEELLVIEGKRFVPTPEEEERMRQ